MYSSQKHSFEGVCLNYRHPDPRRVWKGGPELQSVTVIRGYPRIPRMNSKSAESAAKNNARALARRSRAMFFRLLKGPLGVYNAYFFNRN